MDEKNLEQASHQDGSTPTGKAMPSMKPDKHGIPLTPQPSDHPDDPLNWSPLYKAYIAGLVSALAFTAQLGSALINPAFVLMSKDLHITVEQASYCTTVFILFGGVPVSYTHLTLPTKRIV